MKNRIEELKAVAAWKLLTYSQRYTIAKQLNIKTSPYNNFLQIPVKARKALIKYFNK